MTDPSSSCPVCFESFTKSLRKQVNCPYCQKICCSDCCKQYLISSLHEAHCMFCKVGWNADFLRDTFTNNWLTKIYGAIEAANLWEREKSLLPSTQNIIEKEDFLHSFDKQAKHALRLKAREMNKLLNIIINDHQSDENSFMQMYQAICKWQSMMKQNQISFPAFPTFFDPETINKLFSNYKETTEEKKQKATFVKPCPAPDCRGFLSTQWKCGICSTKVCPRCLVIIRLKNNEITVNHICKAEDIATAELIAKDSKNCPKCGVSIQKTEGCNQMWCTNCNTAFSWKTLEIINGAIHNPHYFEWSQRISRNNNETIFNHAATNNGFCDQDIRLDGRTINSNIQTLIRTLNLSMSNDCLIILNKIINFVRIMLHISDFNQERRNGAPESFDTTTNQNIRYLYLKKQINEDQAKSNILQKYKKFRFDSQRRQIILMLRQATNNVLGEFMNLPALTQRVIQFNDKDMHDWLVEILKQLDQVRLLYNNSMINHHERYKSSAHFYVVDPLTPSSACHYRTRNSKPKK
jgi:hypothetical protein